MFICYGRNQKPSFKQVQRRFQMCVNSRTIFYKFKEQYSDVCSKREQVFTKCPKKKQDKNCQVNMDSVCSDKKCQDTMFLQLLKPEKSSIKWLPKQAVPGQYKRLCSNKNCQSTRCYRKKCPSETDVW